MLEKVVFSDRAMIALLSETQEHINTETGGVFLGYRCGKVWYVVEAIDPGPNSTFEPAFFEYDNDYLNHLMNKISCLYRKPLDIVGLWHRHPGSFDRFSGTDDVTNLKYAKRNTEGAISALVNIDPTIRLTVYHVGDPLEYNKVDYVVGDRYIPRSLMAYVKRKNLIDAINQSEREFAGSFLDKLRKVGGFIASNEIKDSFGNDSGLDNSLKDNLSIYLKSPAYGSKVNGQTEADRSDDCLELILEAIESDMDYFSSINYEITMRLVNDCEILLSEVNDEDGNISALVSLLCRDDSIVMHFGENDYLYYPGLFKDAFESRALGGSND